MLPPMGENENEESESSQKRPISRRSFLAGGAAFGGVVLWGAAAAPAGAAGAPPIGGAGNPPILNPPLYPPILPGSGPFGSGTGRPYLPPPASGGTNNGPGVGGTEGGSGSGSDRDHHHHHHHDDDGGTLPHGHTGTGGETAGIFDALPSFRFRLRGTQGPF
jgi:hypothetical protein